MKIIHLISGYLGQGGAERLVVDLAEAQAAMGHDVTICTFCDRNERSLPVPKGVKCQSFGKEKGFSPTLSFRINSFLNAKKPDVVNCHLPAVFLYMIPSLMGRKKMIFYYTIHSNPIQEESRIWVRKLRRCFINSGKLHFVAISQTVKISFEDLYGVSGIKMIYNGRKQTKKSFAFESVQSEVNSYKKDDYTNVFVAVGRLTAEKNHRLMIEAFSKLTDENAILLILGQGDKNQFDNIISNNVFLLGPKDNVHDYLYCADAFCMSSVYEGFPVSIIEAFSVGLPVLSTCVGGIPDAVKDGQNGLLCEVNLASYEAMLKRFLALEENERKCMGQNGRLFFEERYDIRTIAAQYLALYNSMLTK